MLRGEASESMMPFFVGTGVSGESFLDIGLTLFAAAPDVLKANS